MSTSKLIRGITQIFLAEALLVPTGFATAVFLARGLKPAGYGLFALITQFVFWVEYLLISGLENTTIKFVSGTEEKKAVINTVYILYFGIGSTVGLIIYTLSPHIAGLVKAPETSPLLKLLSVDIPLFSMAHAGRHILMGLSQFKKNAVMRSFYWISRLVFIVFFLSIGLGIEGAVIGLISASAIETILGLIFIRPALRNGVFTKLTKFLQFLAPLHLAVFYKRLLGQELLVLRAFGSTAISTGFYGAAKNLSIAPILLSRSINPTLLPTLQLQMKRGNTEAARKRALTVIRAIFWFLPVTAILAGAADETICLIFGSDYAEAGPIFSLLVFAGMGLFMINNGIVIFTAWDKPQLSVSVTWLMVPLAVMGYFICIPHWNSLGAAIATLFAISAGVTRTMFILYQKWRLYPPPLTVIRSLVCSALTITIARVWFTPGPLVIAKLTLLIIFSGLFLWKLGEFSSRERFFIQQFIKERVLSMQKGKSRFNG
jgi:O-antigen/teichoic acid export membrane protein